MIGISVPSAKRQACCGSPIATHIARQLIGPRAHKLIEYKEHTNMKPKNTICLWFNKDAHEAARFYAATFPDSKVTAVHAAPSDYPAGKKGESQSLTAIKSKESDGQRF